MNNLLIPTRRDWICLLGRYGLRQNAEKTNLFINSSGLTGGVKITC